MAIIIVFLVILAGLVLAGMGVWGTDSRDPRFSMFPRSDALQGPDGFERRR
ncbi:hypothetical protein ACSMXN_09480 [Jatrophihabitans sp. DSM 45814]